MKQFLIKIIGFAAATLVSVIFVFYQADGSSDPFYKKFTTSKKTSLILGSSRVSFGIMPEIVNQQLGMACYNYSFTYNTAPYGQSYFNSIKKKLDTTSRNQLFILGVDPWVLSTEHGDANDPNHFEENELFVGKLSTVNSNPNFEYLLHHYDEPYIKLLYNKSPMLLQDDGFLKLTMEMTDTQIRQKKAQTMANYMQKQDSYTYSSLRLDYLKQIITYLKDYGEVYMVRLPIDEDFLELENEFIPNFDRLIGALAEEAGSPYFNFSDVASNYAYTDGHHLIPASAKKLTMEIVQNIKEARNQGHAH